MTHELQGAIDRLYKVFAVVGRLSAMEFCPCGCTKAEAIGALLHRDIASIEFASLADYSFSAMTTQGGVQDFKYFLPRLLQGIATEEYRYNPEVLFGKLRYANFLSWPPAEIDAVRSFMEQLWKLAIQTYPVHHALPGFPEIETLLSSIAQTGVAISPYLLLWSEAATVDATKNLLHFVTLYGEEFADGNTLSAGFWESASEQALELRQWLLQPQVWNWIQERKDLPIDSGYEHLLAPALAVLAKEMESTGV
ncbi:hypothetical protein FTW19_02720 [Terriglobus albidus]|uniref:Uncharacterized protein n=1 Tax=Terriglobus albidus TaxID=1592106 RepID=A0A5B9E7A1_9BACT|nr:hypothetical protein [Terriglobus albidus]QEE27015.1 hypothetical protein FTW19_02720 [Terriglobus albidus]